MSQYTEKSLNKILKRDLIPIVLSLEEQNVSLLSLAEQNVWGQKWSVAEMRKFNENVSKLQLELPITKRVNTELTKRVVTLERQSWANG